MRPALTVGATALMLPPSCSHPGARVTLLQPCRYRPAATAKHLFDSIGWPVCFTSHSCTMHCACSHSANNAAFAVMDAQGIPSGEARGTRAGV